MTKTGVLKPKLVSTLQDTQLRLIQVQDQDLDSREMSVACSSPAHTGFLSSDPLGWLVGKKMILGQRDP